MRNRCWNTPCPGHDRPPVRFSGASQDVSMKSRPGSLNVASVTMSCHQDPDANLRKMTDIIGSIMGERPETQLIVFGEMILGWYDPEEMSDYHRRISIHLSHDSLGELSRMAFEFGVYICAGFSENDGGYLYNSQVLFDRLGDPRVHRKHNLETSEVNCGYHPGNDPFTLTGVMGHRTALLVGSDLARFSTARKLAGIRPDLVILSLADDSDPGFLMAGVNARMYDSWIVTANRFGTEDDRVWEGHTFISDPRGRLTETSSGRETVLYQKLVFPSPDPVSRFFRKLITRAPLPFIILSNWKRLRRYFQPK